MENSNQDTFTSPFVFKTDWKSAFEDEEFIKVFSSDILENYIINKRWYGGKASTLKYIEVVDHFKITSKKNTYYGIGEFHLYGEDADLPVPRRMVALARERDLLLHAHSDVDAIERLLRQWPQARVLWAHSGFDRPEKVREVLRRHARLRCDLAFRGDHATLGRVDPAWREAFLEFPDRFMIGTDTFTPERWHYIDGHASYSRGWLADLPADVAQRIGWRNAVTLLRGAGAARV